MKANRLSHVRSFSFPKLIFFVWTIFEIEETRETQEEMQEMAVGLQKKNVILRNELRHLKRSLDGERPVQHPPRSRGYNTYVLPARLVVETWGHGMNRGFCACIAGVDLLGLASLTFS